MISPALCEASTDTRLRGAPIQLLVYLHGKLDTVEYRALKLEGIAHDLSMDKATAGRAMHRLVQCGYIREGSREKPGGRCYRLLETRGIPAKKTA